MLPMPVPRSERVVDVVIERVWGSGPGVFTDLVLGVSVEATEDGVATAEAYVVTRRVVDGGVEVGLGDRGCLEHWERLLGTGIQSSSLSSRVSLLSRDDERCRFSLLALGADVERAFRGVNYTTADVQRKKLSWNFQGCHVIMPLVISL
jgi:hypothetical protein